MTLGALIRDYRTSRDMSQRQFAAMCGLSNGYISMLEKGMNPKTKQPVTPTLQAFQKIAAVMGISIAELFDRVDDMPVDMSTSKKENSPSEPQLKEGEEMLLNLFRQVPEEQQDLVLQMIKAALGSQK